MARGFIFSPEVINKKLSNTDFIKILYQALMGRNADESGLSYWKNMLDNGVSREYVFKGFAESSEFTQICNSYRINRGTITLSEPRDRNANLTMFIFRCYEKALERKAEISGLNYYAEEILSERVTPVQAAQNWTFMGREYDQSGLNYHLSRMSNGVSREEILLGFAYAPESTILWPVLDSDILFRSLLLRIRMMKLMLIRFFL